MFLIFLLEFHALMLTITGPPDLDLYGMVKDAVQDRAGGDRIAQVFSPGLFFDIGCKNQRKVEMVSFIQHLEQQMGLFGYLELQPVMAHFINDEQIGIDIFAQTFKQVLFKNAAVQLANQGGTGGI